MGRTEGAEADWRLSVFDWRVVARHGWVHAARHARGPLAGRARHWAGLRSGVSGVRAADGKAPAGGHRRGSAQAAAGGLVLGQRAVQRADAGADGGEAYIP